jgi:hypothetical protein
MSTQTRITETQEPENEGTEQSESQEDNFLVFGTGENKTTINLRTGDLEARFALVQQD